MCSELALRSECTKDVIYHANCGQGVMNLTDEELQSYTHEKLLRHCLQLKIEYNEYVVSSQQMEKLLEDELEDMKTKFKAAELRSQQAVLDAERYQKRQETERGESAKLEETLRHEVNWLRDKCEKQREEIRRLEQRNDDLERRDRCNEQLALDLEQKWNVSIEKIALLENELYERQVAAEEMYRLRDDLKSERPLLVVEPLRVERQEETPEEPLPGPSSPKLTMRRALEFAPTPPDTGRDAWGAENKPSAVQKPCQSNKGLTGCVNRIVNDLMLKVDRLEHILSDMRIQQTRNSGHFS
ncbi:unnamed protein product [Caenorhabditis auriculariae]|uniref:Uncharacterized protein n=1 Tax=Caenorhabditis auriculariae TaxID=2777116 RepID=A0A8S1HJ06_9PELO|nr:unnamed protein product [Caenorhabditis auriculariae]